MSACTRLLQTSCRGAVGDHACALVPHLADCRQRQGRAFNLALWAERLHVQLARRPMTLVAAATAVLALSTFGG